MFDIGYIMTYWLVWWTTLLLYWQGRLSVDFFVISTLIMAAAAGGCLALLLYERANRARIIDASVAEKVDAIEQRLINALTELDQVRRLYNDRVAELQGLQRRQLDILVVEGPDRALGWDYTNIRNLGYNVTMLHSPTWSTFVEHMDALRRRDATPYHIHFAMHGQQHGIEFSDRIAKPLEISEQTKGVRYAFLASCDSNTTAYSMRLIAGHTLSFWGGVGMDEAAQFVYEYYRAIRDGSTATQALYVAKERAPVDAAEKIVAA